MALSNVKGTEYTKYYTGGIGNMVTKSWGNDVKYIYDEYTVPAGETVAVSTSLYMGRVPKNARILGFYFSQSGSGGATTGGIKIGSTAATGTAALTDMTSTTTQQLTCVHSLAKTPLAADADVTILLTSDADIDAATTLSLTTLYVMDV